MHDMPETRFALRLALPHEVDELVRIDDEACSLFAAIGLSFDHLAGHPFARKERARYAVAISERLAHVAVDSAGERLGFATFGFVDAAPYLDQLSVRPGSMRRGIGAALIERAVAFAAQQPLWLTTYAHVTWNAAYYERFGFTRVPDSACGLEMQGILAEQRAVLPAPEQRVALVRRPAVTVVGENPTGVLRPMQP